jgi:hypothetical protein
VLNIRYISIKKALIATLVDMLFTLFFSVNLLKHPREHVIEILKSIQLYKGRQKGIKPKSIGNISQMKKRKVKNENKNR